MPFELTEVTQITVTNTNPRRELHGEEMVRAIDIAFSLTGENTLLDLIEPGLREHHYFNKAAKEGQEPLPGLVMPLPNLRHPMLPLSYAYAKGQKWRGYRFTRDFGMQLNPLDFTDAVLSNLHYDLNEGGSVTIKATIQYNGDELQDNEVYGELSGLASEGDIFVKLLAPSELLPVKKGYRAGKPDTPPAGDDGDDGQGTLGDNEDDAEDADGEVKADTPEAALRRANGGGE